MNIFIEIIFMINLIVINSPIGKIFPIIEVIVKKKFNFVSSS